MKTENERAAFAECITALAVVFGREVDATLIRAYSAFLGDLPIDRIRHAVNQAARTKKFMPSVTELRELAGCASAESRAISAWSIVSDAAGRLGSYVSVDFEDGVINAVIRSMGGWPYLLTRTGDDFEKWARQEFIKAYVAIESVVKPEECKPVCGLTTEEGKRPRLVKVDYVRDDPRLIALCAQRRKEQSRLEAVKEKKSGMRGLVHIREVTTDR